MKTKTLAIHPGALGDVIMLSRLLQKLPGEVTLVTSGSKGTLLKGLGAIDRALDFDSLPMHEVFTDTPLQQCRLPELLGSYDRLISCFAASDGKAELRLAELCGAESATFIPIRPPADFNGHLTELWGDMLGITPPPEELSSQVWCVSAEWRKDGLDELHRIGVEGAYVVLHPGGGAVEKCWEIERFCQLAEHIDTSRPLGHVTPVFILGPVELERWGENIREDLRREFCVLESLPLKTLTGILVGADSFVGNDSGCSHLAGGVGTKTLTLFGPTNPDHFKPLGPKTSVIQAKTMKNIPVERIMEKFPLV